MLSEVNCIGVEQTAKLESSRLHSNWPTPKSLVPAPSVSFPPNVNDIELNRVLLLLATTFSLLSIALMIAVVGGTVSTAQLMEAGVGLRFPTLSSDTISTS